MSVRALPPAPPPRTALLCVPCGPRGASALRECGSAWKIPLGCRWHTSSLIRLQYCVTTRPMCTSHVACCMLHGSHATQHFGVIDDFLKRASKHYRARAPQAFRKHLHLAAQALPFVPRRSSLRRPACRAVIGNPACRSARLAHPLPCRWPPRTSTRRNSSQRATPSATSPRYGRGLRVLIA